MGRARCLSLLYCQGHKFSMPGPTAGFGNNRYTQGTRLMRIISYWLHRNFLFKAMDFTTMGGWEELHLNK